MRVAVLAAAGKATGAISADEHAALKWLLRAEARQAQLVADLAEVYTLPEDQADLLLLVAQARQMRAAFSAPAVVPGGA